VRKIPLHQAATVNWLTKNEKADRVNVAQEGKKFAT
jgi:hypothetical protein